MRKNRRAQLARGWPGDLEERFCSCSDAPDTSMQQQAALMQAEMSKEQLAWAKEIYANEAPERAAAAGRAREISDAQLSSMRLADASAREALEHHKTTFQPLETKMATAALGYDTPERREAAASQALADVDSAASLGRETAMREMAARGVDPSSPAAAMTLARATISQAAQRAAAANGARRQVETVGDAKLADAVSLGRNIASAQGTTAQLALSAGDKSAGNAQLALQPSLQGQTMVNQAYGGARAGLSSAASIYGDVANQQAGAAAQGASNVSAGIGAIGTVAAVI